MEYELSIICDQCTEERRQKSKHWPAYSFVTLTDAVNHILETKADPSKFYGNCQHDVRIVLEVPSSYD